MGAGIICFFLLSHLFSDNIQDDAIPLSIIIDYTNIDTYTVSRINCENFEKVFNKPFRIKLEVLNKQEIEELMILILASKKKVGGHGPDVRALIVLNYKVLNEEICLGLNSFVYKGELYETSVELKKYFRNLQGKLEISVKEN